MAVETAEPPRRVYQAVAHASTAQNGPNVTADQIAQATGLPLAEVRAPAPAPTAPA
jgi:hypothetical protein